MHLSTFVRKKLPGKRGNENKEGNFFHGEKNLRRRWSIINKIILYLIIYCLFMDRKFLFELDKHLCVKQSIS